MTRLIGMPIYEEYEEPPYRQVLLTKIREGVHRRISRELVVSLSQQDVATFISNDLVLALEAELLAEELPPVTLTDEQTSVVAVYATWREHFRAAYRETWWGRLLRMRAPKMVDQPVKRVVTTTVRQRWTYPQATTVMPGDRFGRVVLKIDAHHRVSAWDIIGG
jgi:hypothetical protein